MNRREWMGVSVGTFFATGCQERKREVVQDAEIAWSPLLGKWAAVSDANIVEDDGVLRIGWAETLAAARWEGDVPSVPFELEMQARRVDGTDFFCAITFPARGADQCVTMVAGGWGGALVGISSIDEKDASDNETTMHHRFENGRWYQFRILCDGKRISTWIDGKQVINGSIEGKRLSLRPGPISVCAPFGLATWQTTGEIRGMRWRRMK